MRLAFLVYQCLPCTGRLRALQFFLHELAERGHACRVYSTSRCESLPPGTDWHQLKVPLARGQARGRQQFFNGVQAHLSADPVDGVVGFDPFPGLDFYIALEAPWPDRVSALQGVLYRFSPGFRRLAERERELFAPGCGTHVFVRTQSRLERYRELYDTQNERLHLLAPGLGPDRTLPEGADERRKAVRAELELEPQEYTLLFVSNGFNAGGLDRVIHTLARLKEEQPSVTSRLLVVGPDRPARFRMLARRLKVTDEIRFLGVREDIVDLMLAADVLVYPARYESTGTVLLEAVALGLPSVAMEHCGHGQQVKEARAGILLPSPFSQEQLDRAVMRFMDGIFRADCRESGRLYARLHDLGGMYREAAELLERFTIRGP